MRPRGNVTNTVYPGHERAGKELYKAKQGGHTETLVRYKRLRSPGIDSKESISPAYVASRARTFKCLWGPGIDSKE